MYSVRTPGNHGAVTAFEAFQKSVGSGVGGAIGAVGAGVCAKAIHGLTHTDLRS